LHGLAHIGAIKAFQELGVQPVAIAGCSAGAIAGGLWAAGKTAEEIRDVATDSSWQDLLLWRVPRFGLGELTRLENLIDEKTDAARIESLRTPFAAVATNLATGRAEVLRSGRLSRAIAASASVPLRYEPLVVDGNQLVDGALTSPLPVDAARALGADFVVALDVAMRPYEERISDMVGVAFQMFRIMVNQLSIEQARKADLLIRLDVHVAIRGREDSAAVIALGERAVHEHWPMLRSALGQ
jgi:NTE family protein